MLENSDIIYAAGFFDGEGFVGTKEQKGYVYLRSGITNTNQDILNWFSKNFGGNVYSVNINSPSHIKSGYNRKPQWSWGINGNEAYDFIKTIYPYARLRKNDLLIAMFVHENRLTLDVELSSVVLSGVRALKKRYGGLS